MWYGYGCTSHIALPSKYLQAKHIAIVSLLGIAGLSIEHLYPFGLDAGDTLMNRNDDRSDLVELTVVFPFFNKGEAKIYVRKCFTGIADD